MISGRPLFWFVLVLLIYLVWRAPQQMSAALGALGTAFVAIGEGMAAFIGNLTNTPV
jgi:hypothetical protein